MFLLVLCRLTPRSPPRSSHGLRRGSDHVDCDVIFILRAQQRCVVSVQFRVIRPACLNLIQLHVSSGSKVDHTSSCVAAIKCQDCLSDFFFFLSFFVSRSCKRIVFSASCLRRVKPFFALVFLCCEISIGLPADIPFFDALFKRYP